MSFLASFKENTQITKCGKIASGFQQLLRASPAQRCLNFPSLHRDGTSVPSFAAQRSDGCWAQGPEG